MRLEDVVRELMRGDDELSKLKLDVIRVLAIFNGVSWMSELIPDIMKVHSYILDHRITDDLLETALHELESEGLVHIESRMRGMFPSRNVYEDKLIKLRDLEIVKRVLTEDKIYKSYLSKQMEIMWRAMKRT